jgi:predicted RNA-binding Zn ribbon-like protein
MSRADEIAGSLDLLGGRPVLDFTNTADWHASRQPVEFLTNYGALVSWSVHVGILSEDVGQRLRERAAREPERADAVLQRALVLREAVYRLFAAISHGREPGAGDLEIFNEELSAALARSSISPIGASFGWNWTGDADALDRMLWAVVHDAADLLTSEDLDRVGQCADARCGWFFVDRSRNRSRRWCSMAYCGNRAKARRHYRQHADPEPGRR